MKFREIFRFELMYQVRRPWPWLFVVVLLVLSFLMTRDGSLSEVLYADFFLNSPFAIAKTTVFGSLIWLVMAGSIAGDAAARDIALRIYPLTYTTPIKKAQFLGGRFLAALVLNALLLLAVPLGILLGVYLPGVDAELIGPFRPAAFFTAYVYIALPNAFVATAIQFLLAARSGRSMAAYFGSFLIVFVGFFVASMLLFKRGIGSYLDPIGIRFVVEDIAHLWTTIEKNTRLLQFEGIVLKNRLLWLVIGLLTLAISYLTFRFSHRTSNTTWWNRFIFWKIKQTTPRNDAIGNASIKSLTVPQVQRSFNFFTNLHQTIAIGWSSFQMIAKSWAGFAMLVVIPLLTIPVLLDQMESNGVPLLPTTPRILAEMTFSLADELSRWVIIPFLIVYFAGELIWREREVRMAEITDTMPGSEWPPFIGKLLGLSLVIFLFLVMLTLTGIFTQFLQDYQQLEVDLYLKIMFGLQLPEYLLFALLALVVHVVVNQKYIGHLVAIIVFVFITLASLFGIEHNLLIYGAAPGWSYTGMRGFGGSFEPWLWFKLYWTAWALLLAVLAKLFWVRGKETSANSRFQLARHRFTRSTAILTAGITLFIISLGGFIFYNTNMLNKYFTAAELKERGAEYERRYGKYANTPQPQLTRTKLQVDIYPENRKLEIHGTYYLINRSTELIDTIHMATKPGTVTSALTFNQEASCVVDDKEFFHQIFALKDPLKPGDSIQLNFQVQVKPNGFTENGVDASVEANGTYFTNALLPTIGYQESRELLIASERRKYGLSPRPVIASLYDADATKKSSEGIQFEAVVRTSKNQVAVAPGVLRQTWTKRNRRYFHYATDKPIGNEWGFFSANYKVHESIWTPEQHELSDSGKVKIKIFHDPRHTAHLDRVVRSIHASLNYYTAQFGPYRHNYINVIEHPGLGTGMHADAATLSHGEGFTEWNPIEDEENHDHPFAIVAHEMAHQWTIPYAAVEGAPVMSESIAWYYGIKLVEHAKGIKHRQHLLNYMRQPYPYPAIRRGEPLLRGLDPYLSYRRGPFALYTISEYIGEERLNKALRTLLEKHRQPNARLATTLDLYRELSVETPDSLQYLLHDLFKVNTYWELDTKRASVVPLSKDSWKVTLEVHANKIVFDSNGTKKQQPMNEWIEIGVFENGKPSGTPINLKKHRIKTGKQFITAIVPRKPSHAGIDPNYLLIDLEPEDNIKSLK